MGCCLACFGASKNDKRRNFTHNVPSQNSNFRNQYKPILQPSDATKQENPEKPINLVLECRVKPPEKQLSSGNQGELEEQLSSDRGKKVTFDSNVKEYKHICLDDYDEAPGEIQDTEKDVNQNCNNPVKSPSASEGGSTLSSLGLFPPNHRYCDCPESDYDEEELDHEDNDLNEDEGEHDEGDKEVVYVDEDYDDDYHPSDVQEFSPGSCSSMESRIECPETGMDRDGHHAKTPAFNRCARNRAGYVHSVLNPVENTAQWKVVKAKGTPLLKHQKENFQMDPTLKQSTLKFKSKLDEPKNDNEVAVDASLSTWLISSQRTPPNKAIPIGLEPISSGATLSSYGSNSVRSQEESPNEGIPNTTSKYREDKRVHWNSTPFESRLEKALS